MMKTALFILATATSIALVSIGIIKVRNELAMTKAYEAQAFEQKRIADTAQAQIDLKEAEFSATLECKLRREPEMIEDAKCADTITSLRYYNLNNQCMRPGKVKISMTCLEK